MSLLPFENLPVHSPRKFVPATAELGEWSAIKPLFDKLEQRIRTISTSADLEHWLLDWSELSAALDEEASKRYIAMTCHTDNSDAEKAYLHFVEHIEPASTPQLMTRRSQLHEQIAEIQREVEMKAGLHMGVAIHDDRSKLNELYLEARQIVRELVRRFQNGDGAVKFDTVRAEF